MATTEANDKFVTVTFSGLVSLILVLAIMRNQLKSSSTNEPYAVTDGRITSLYKIKPAWFVYIFNHKPTWRQLQVRQRLKVIWKLFFLILQIQDGWLANTAINNDVSCKNKTVSPTLILDLVISDLHWTILFKGVKCCQIHITEFYLKGIS